MPSILFPTSTAPGRDVTESAGRLVNAYAERLQEGAPGPHVRRRAPGLTAFSETSETNFRGMWYDGENYVYAAFTDTLIKINSLGVESTVGSVLGARVTFIDSYVNTSNLTTYTYAAVPFGPANDERRIVVAVLFDDAGDYPPAAMTIGGVAATSIINLDSRVALYIANVPTGTTGDVVVQYATAANRSAIGVWRINGLDSNTAYDTESDADDTLCSVNIDVPTGGGIVAATYNASPTGVSAWTGVTEDFSDVVEATKQLTGGSANQSAAATVNVTFQDSLTIVSSKSMVVASWEPAGSGDIVTFAKNNKTPTADQVLATPGLGAFTFTTSAVNTLDVDGELPNSVCFGEGYFFFTIPDGRCFASGLNDTTVNSLDVIRAEGRAEPLIRGVFFDGELYLFGETHTEVWASGGNPNATGFPLNRTTIIWRGLIAPLAVCGFEEGFHSVLIWVADDNSVWMLQGYQPVEISPPDLNRVIADCANKSAIRAFVYHIDGHPCVVIDVAQEATWVYDLEEQVWHERKTGTLDYWRATGNSVKAFGKWLVGDHLSGNIYEIDKDALNDGGTASPVIIESIAMESFPTRLRIDRADFNFVAGVGTSAEPDPKVKISWSDDGGHKWSNPVERKLGESGRTREHVRVNRVGLTGSKGRRWRLRVDDEVYVGLIGGSMEVSGRP